MKMDKICYLIAITSALFCGGAHTARAQVQGHWNDEMSATMWVVKGSFSALNGASPKVAVLVLENVIIRPAGWYDGEWSDPIYEWAVTKNEHMTLKDMGPTVLISETTNDWKIMLGVEANSPVDFLSLNHGLFDSLLEAGTDMGIRAERQCFCEDEQSGVSVATISISPWSPHHSAVYGRQPAPDPIWPGPVITGNEYGFICDDLIPYVTNFTLHSQEQSPERGISVANNCVAMESEDVSACYFQDWQATLNEAIRTNWTGTLSGNQEWRNPCDTDKSQFLSAMREAMPASNFNPPLEPGFSWGPYTHEFLYVAGLSETGQVWTLYYTTNLATAWVSNTTLTVDGEGIGHVATTMPTNAANLFVIAKRVTQQGATNLSPVFGFIEKTLPGSAMSVLCNPLSNGGNDLAYLFRTASEGDQIRVGNSSGQYWNASTYTNGNWSTNYVLAVGEGFAYSNNSTNARTVVFKGQVVQNSTNSLSSGFSLKGSILPFSGHLENDLNLPAAAGDSVQVWNGNGYDYSSYDIDLGGWDNPPLIETAEGFWFGLSGGATRQWIQNWTPLMP